MRVWDYDLPKNWQPKNDAEWEWFLIRRINYGELKGLKEAKLRQYFPAIERRLDPGKRLMLAYYLQKTDEKRA